MYVKKLKPSWEPQEHPGILVGDIVDFPGNVEKLVRDGDVALCDEYGNEVSAYETLGWITDHELDEFREYKRQQRQQALGKSLENERESLLAEAEKIKAEQPEQQIVQPQPVEPSKSPREELEEKKAAWAKKMADARAAKKAVPAQA